MSNSLDKRHRRLSELFAQVSDLDPTQRTAFLQEACGDDRELLEGVEALMRHDRATQDVILDLVRDARPAAGDAAAGGETLPVPGDAPETLPDRIGSYRVLSELGRGGMGAVYLAEDPRLERRIALKILPPSLARDSTHRARFEREAKLLAAVNHPNIATIYTLEDADGRSFLTMEWITGEVLSQRLTGGPLAIADTLVLCRGIASALEIAHRQGIVHRDLKPQNIMLTRDDHAKVLDFGIAKSVGAASKVTVALEVLGTPGYMSPEQLRGGALDTRDDIWAFGCIAYECLAGKPAFSGNTVFDTVAATLKTRPDWTAFPAHTPKPLSDLVKKCLTQDREERLEDITLARRVLEEEIARRSFPSKRSHRRHASDGLHTLPVQLSSFVGRETALEKVRCSLERHRLVTLTGSGGVGKTRLALAVAEQLRGELGNVCAFVELAPLAEPDLVTQTVAATLGVKDRSHSQLLEALFDRLTEKRAILILDNCEHVLEGCAELTELLLKKIADLRILATSREKLGLTGEFIYPVPPLGLPTLSRPVPLEEIAQTESVRLFTDRASAEGTGFALTRDNVAAVVEICQRLDGIPLAIELAAPRLRVLSPEDIARRLDDRFRLLSTSSRTALPRHRTLRALIEWSTEQLTKAEHHLFRRLSVFVGGWSLAAMEEVCAGDGIESWEVLDLLSHLVDKSLVEVDDSGDRARYGMLETVREYARDRLQEAEEGDTFLKRHLDYFRTLATRAAKHLDGPHQTEWLSRLEAEHDNLRLALETSALEPAVGVQFATDLGKYWDKRGHLSEGRVHCNRILSIEASPQRTVERARLLDVSGNLAYRQGDYAEARTLVEDAIGIQRELEDSAGLAGSLCTLGNVCEKQGGNFAGAEKCFEKSVRISRRLGDRLGVARAVRDQANLCLNTGELEKARLFLRESHQIFREVDDRSGIAWCLYFEGRLARTEGEFSKARALLEESMEIWQDIGDPHAMSASLHFLARLAEANGDYDRARSLHRESLHIRSQLRDRYCTAFSLEGVGFLAATMGDPLRAARLLGAAEALRNEIQAVIMPLLREESERYRTRIKGAVEEPALARAWSEGSALRWEEVIAYALEDGG